MSRDHAGRRPVISSPDRRSSLADIYGKAVAARTPEPLEYPVFLNLDDVLGLIAYGRTMALRDEPPGISEFFERWKSKVTGGYAHPKPRNFPLLRDMHKALARVRRWQRCKRQGLSAWPSPLRPLGAGERARVRRVFLCHNGTAADTIRHLWADLRQLYAVTAEHEAKIEHSIGTLCRAVADESLPMLGRPGNWRKRRSKRGIYKRVPPEFFADPLADIWRHRSGWAVGGLNGSMEDYVDWEGPDWGEIRFRRDEVFRLWPPSSQDAAPPPALRAMESETPARDDSGGASPPLPPWFTLMQAVAWSIARDARIVDYASPHRNAVHSYVINHVLPNGKRVSGAEPAPTGMTLIWLDLFAAYDPNACAPTETAIPRLLNDLRAGRIVATGLWSATHARGPIGTDEWALLTLDTPAGNARNLMPFRTNGTHLALQPESRWRDTLLPLDQLVVVYPPWPQPADAPDISWRSRHDNPAAAVRSRRMQRFTDEQRLRREWIGFEEIADWCARVPGDIKPDEERRTLAYTELRKSLMCCEFELAGRSRVLFLSRESPWAKMTKDRLTEAARSFDEDILRSAYLSNCWIPYDSCRRWFDARKLPFPPWSAPEASGALHGLPVLGRRRMHLPEPELRPKATNRAVRQWFRTRVANWPDDKRAPSEAEDWHAIKQHFLPGLSRNEDFRRARQEETPEAWRKQGRRAPWGVARRSAEKSANPARQN